MRMHSFKILALMAVVSATPLFAQQPAAPAAPQGAGRQGAAAPAAGAPKHEDTEFYEPVPPVVTPGANNTAPPSDAIVLFDGKNLNEWVADRDKSEAKWTVADGVITVNKARGAGNIETKRKFRNYQLH